MFGSSMLAAFFDAIIAIGISNTDPTIRYVKTCKFRSGPYPYPAEWVALYRIEQVDGFLQFSYVGRGVEADHLKASRLSCPACGQPHCFTPYVDEKDEILDKTVGRCDWLLNRP